MAIKNTNDITKIFTLRVNELLAQGMSFVESMAGHQGEVMKVDLHKAGTTYRVLLTSSSGLRVDGRYYGVCVANIEVRKYEGVKSNDTLWNNKGETVSTDKFYSLSNNSFTFSDNMYTDSLEEAIAAQRLRTTRARAWDFEDDREIPFNAKKIAAIVNTRPGCKSVKSFQIASVMRTGHRYKISFKTPKDAVYVYFPVNM